MNYCYKHISEIVNKDNFNELYNSLPTLRKKKVDNLYNLKDKYLSIGVYVLLMSMIPKGNYVYLEDNYGKPYFKDNPIYFSLSHSGDYVAVATNNSPVGIDIQIIKDIDHQKLSKKIMNDKEYDAYLHSSNQQKYFYEIFTKKEAYSKHLGKGLKIDFKEVDIKKIRTFKYSNNRFILSIIH